MTSAPTDQHDLMVQTLLESGAIPAERFRRSAMDEVADVFFPDENWIVEVKTITHNRFADQRVSERLGERLAKDSAAFGGPIPFGSLRVNLGTLPKQSGTNALRIIGETVQRALKKANGQIGATKKSLGRNGTGGCVALVSPFPELDLGVLGWLANDSLREGGKKEIDSFIFARSSLAAPACALQSPKAAMVFAVRGNVGMPHALKIRVATNWAKAHGGNYKDGFPPGDTINDVDF